MFGSGAGAPCMPDTSSNDNIASERVRVRRRSLVFISNSNQVVSFRWLEILPSRARNLKRSEQDSRRAPPVVHMQQKYRGRAAGARTRECLSIPGSP